MLTIFSKQSIAMPSNKLFLFFVIMKRYQFFSEIVIKNVGNERKIKSHSKKKMENFYQQKKYVKNNSSYLYFLIHFQKQILKQLSMTAQQLSIEKC